jgi:hypothetical protein
MLIRKNLPTTELPRQAQGLRAVLIEGEALFGGFELTDLRWQDLREAKVRVGILSAELTLGAGGASDLAIRSGGTHQLTFRGLNKEQAEEIYRIAQSQDQSWREKRRIRELDELRARSGGVQIGTQGGPAQATPGAQPSSDVVTRLQQAKQMLDAKLISDSEYEAIKARVINTV